MKNPDRNSNLTVPQHSRVTDVVHYTAEVYSRIDRQGKVSVNRLVEKFTLKYMKGDKGDQLFVREVSDRFYVNANNFIVKKLNRAQQLSLKVASINDRLEIRVDKHLQIIKIVNLKEIQEEWEKVRSHILMSFEDIKEMVEDFDWQMKSENIQNAFLRDNFLHHLFPGVVRKGFVKGEEIKHNKTISNAISDIDIPIVEERHLLTPKKLFEKTISIGVQAAMDSLHSKFPLDKINVFVGKISPLDIDELKLDMVYSGGYTVDEMTSQIVLGELEYSFTIGKLYQKTVKYNFKMK